MMHKISSLNDQKNSHITNDKNSTHERSIRAKQITKIGALLPVHGRRVESYRQTINEVILTDGMSRAFF